MKEIINNFFILTEIDEGIYACIDKEEGICGGNVGIIDLGDVVVVFDTFQNLEASKFLVELCIDLTKRQPDFLINSHSHLDHILGNQQFSRYTKIISSVYAYNSIIKVAEEFTHRKIPSESDIKKIESRLVEEKDIDTRKMIQYELLCMKNQMNPETKLQTPDLTFSESFEIIGKRKKLTLYTYEQGHSYGDVIAIVNESRICFMGDLLTTASHPWLASGNPYKLLQILEDLLTLDIMYFIPGHGYIGTQVNVILEKEYIQLLIDSVEAYSKNNTPLIATNDLPYPFKNWDQNCLTQNLDVLVKFHQANQKLSS